VEGAATAGACASSTVPFLARLAGTYGESASTRPVITSVRVDSAAPAARRQDRENQRLGMGGGAGGNRLLCDAERNKIFRYAVLGPFLSVPLRTMSEMTKGGPMEGDEEELTEPGLAHDTGRLCWGMWVCDCARCRAL
jgi:hypothetical protein